MAAGAPRRTQGLSSASERQTRLSTKLNLVINLLASVTLFEMMVTIGLGVTLQSVLRVATDWRLVSKAAIASYVIVPAAAVGLLILFHANPYVAAGFLVAAVCPGIPYGPPSPGWRRGTCRCRWG